MRLIVEGLGCIRGERILFEELTFAAKPGEPLLVTGPNGAGKSSLLRLLAGLLHPAAGRIALANGDGELDVATATHLVGHLEGVKGGLTVAENLAFARALLGGEGQEIEAALATLGIARLASFPARILSAGQRRRLALARLLVARRPLWLLDEPTTALDQDGQAALAAMTRKHLSAGGLLVVASHAPLELGPVTEIRLGTGGRA